MTVGEKSIRVHEFGAGPALLMLHGGGAGANGLSNYGKNIDTLATRFRVIVADMPGYSLLDLLGPDYSLIRFDPAVPVEALLASSLPVKLIDAAVPADTPAIRHKLILVRADTHVVWRGDGLPADVSALAQQLTGKGSPA